MLSTSIILFITVMNTVMAMTVTIKALMNKEMNKEIEKNTMFNALERVEHGVDLNGNVMEITSIVLNY